MRLDSVIRLALSIGVLALAGTLPASAQLTNFSIIHTFGRAAQAGHSPRVSVLEGSDGLLYGATENGGNENEDGVIFRVAKDGRGYQVLRRFGLEGLDGSAPDGRLLEGSDGALYGTTSWGGSNGGWGTVFRIGKDGSGYTLLRSFTGSPDAASPQSGVIEGSDGALYGTTRYGGSDNNGTVFRLNRDGRDYRVLWHFTDSERWIRPTGGLIEGTDGRLYGTCSGSGASLGTTPDPGFVWALGRNGEGFAVIHQFAQTAGDGKFPDAGVVNGRDGRLYGTASQGGTHDGGTVFRMDIDGGNYQVLRSFGGAGDGTNLQSTLIEDEAGDFFGTTLRGGQFNRGTVFKLSSTGADYAQLHQFSGTNGDGEFPLAALNLASDGLLYGTTASGGANDVGALFRVSVDGSDYRTLWSFHYIHGGDGIYPSALTEGRDGFLYATTEAGGSANSGALIKCSRDGATYAVLRSFWTEQHDDWYAGPLLEGSDGWIYGTTTIGLGSEEVRLYRIGRDGHNYSVLHLFGQTDLTSGEHISGVIEASDGALYGTSSGGPGTLFRFDKQAGRFEVLRAFGLGTNDDIRPSSALLQAGDGRLYGTALSQVWAGVLYSVSKDGTDYRELRRFDRGTSGWSDAKIIEGSDGWLYGAIPGSTTNPDVIFRIGRDGGGFTVLYQSVSVPGSGVLHILEGRDNALYVSGWAGWESQRNFLFRLNKDGSGFRVLNAEGFRTSMIRGRDGAFYGFGSSQGEVDFGAIIRFGHALQISPTPAGHFTLTCTGIPGYTYELQRSVDLSEWSTLQTFLMPDTLRVELDDAALPGVAAFYRLRVP